MNVQSLLEKFNSSMFNYNDFKDGDLPKCTVSEVFVNKQALEKSVAESNGIAHICGSNVTDKIFFIMRCGMVAPEHEHFYFWDGEGFVNAIGGLESEDQISVQQDFKQNYISLKLLKDYFLPCGHSGIRAALSRYSYTTGNLKWPQYNIGDLQSLVFNELLPEWATHVSFSGSMFKNSRKYVLSREAMIDGNTVYVQYPVYSDIRSISETNPDYEVHATKCASSKKRAMSFPHIVDKEKHVKLDLFLTEYVGTNQ